MPPITRVAAVVFTFAVLAIATAPIAAGRSPMALGVSQFDGRNDPSAVSAFASKVGRKPATWTLWSTWGDASSKAFPKAMAQSLVGMGVTPMVWWEPMRVRGSCDFARHKLIANGRQRSPNRC